MNVSFGIALSYMINLKFFVQFEKEGINTKQC